VEAIGRSRGTAVEISDVQITNAVVYLAKKFGIYAEPSGTTSVAGFIKLTESGYLDGDQSAVCVVTGSGLKTASFHS
jgi:threonine synthase